MLARPSLLYQIFLPLRDGSRKVPIVLLGVLVFCCYLPSLTGTSIWDDEALLRNPLLESSPGLFAIWLTPHENLLEEHYWPFTYTVAWVLRQVAGATPFAFHLTNLVFHWLNAVLVFLCARRLCSRGAWLTAALFAVHPLQVESVAWIVELKNILSFFFAALSAWIFFSCDRRGHPSRGLILGAASFALGMLSKSAIAPFPLALGLLFWSLPEGLSHGKRRHFCGSLLITSAFLLAIDFLVMKSHPKLLPNFSLVERTLLALECLSHYLRTFFFPTHLCAIYPRWTPGTLPIWHYFPALAFCGTSLGVFWFARSYKPLRPLAAALAGSILMLAPTLGFMSFSYQRQAFVADRFAYHALPFLCGACVWASFHIARHLRIPPNILLVAGGVVLFLCMGMSYRRAALYHNVSLLANDTVTKNPRATTARYYLADSLAREGKFLDATAQFTEVFWTTVSALDEREATLDFEKFRDQPIKDPKRAFNAGLIAAAKGYLDQAENAFRGAETDPQLKAQAVLGRAAILWKSGQKEQAVELVRSLYPSLRGETRDATR